ncbi:MAG: tail fiber protein [Ignavibacteria bacterium]|nr:tail fiber protein [Ignavibacteria bacterium]
MFSDMDYIGSINMWPGQWTPEYYALCYGQSLPVSQYQALYSIIMNTYGGNTSSFNLPNFQGFMPKGWDGQQVLNTHGGSSTTTLTLAHTGLGAHTHQGGITVSVPVSDQDGIINVPSGMYLALSQGGDGYADTTDSVMGESLVSITLSQCSAIPANKPIIDTTPPFLCMSFMMLIGSGIYPVKP